MKKPLACLLILFFNSLDAALNVPGKHRHVEFLSYYDLDDDCFDLRKLTKDGFKPATFMRVSETANQSGTFLKNQYNQDALQTASTEVAVTLVMKQIELGTKYASSTEQATHVSVGADQFGINLYMTTFVESVDICSDAVQANIDQIRFQQMTDVKYIVTSRTYGVTIRLDVTETESDSSSTSSKGSTIGGGVKMNTKPGLTEKLGPVDDHSSASSTSSPPREIFAAGAEKNSEEKKEKSTNENNIFIVGEVLGAKFDFTFPQKPGDIGAFIDRAASDVVNRKLQGEILSYGVVSLDEARCQTLTSKQPNDKNSDRILKVLNIANNVISLVENENEIISNLYSNARKCLNNDHIYSFSESLIITEDRISSLKKTLKQTVFRARVKNLTIDEAVDNIARVSELFEARRSVSLEGHLQLYRFELLDLIRFINHLMKLRVRCFDRSRFLNSLDPFTMSPTQFLIVFSESSYRALIKQIDHQYFKTFLNDHDVSMLYCKAPCHTLNGSPLNQGFLGSFD